MTTFKVDEAREDSLFAEYTALTERLHQRLTSPVKSISEREMVGEMTAIADVARTLILEQRATLRIVRQERDAAMQRASDKDDLLVSLKDMIESNYEDWKIVRRIRLYLSGE